MFVSLSLKLHKHTYFLTKMTKATHFGKIHFIK